MFPSLMSFLISKHGLYLTVYLSILIKLENVAINNVLPLKAARRDAITNLNVLMASDTRDLISMVTFTFSRRHQHIRLASAPFYFIPFGNVWLGSVSACNAWYEGWVRTLILF